MTFEAAGANAEQVAYWNGLVDWLRDVMLAEAKISPADLALPIITDSPQEARDIIMRSINESDWRSEPEADARRITRAVLGVSEES